MTRKLCGFSNSIKEICLIRLKRPLIMNPEENDLLLNAEEEVDEVEEEDADDTPGMIPAGTPGDQPEDEDKRGFGDEVKKALNEVSKFINKVQPRSVGASEIFEKPKVSKDSTPSSVSSPEVSQRIFKRDDNGFIIGYMDVKE